MRKIRKTAVTVVFTLFVVLSLCVGGIGAFANGAATSKQDENLYYFVNVGAESITEVEKDYRLTGSLGSGDKAYESGWGYTVKGTALESGTDSVFASFVGGEPSYKFDLPAGNYQVAVGVINSDGASVSASGAESTSVSGAAKQVISLAAVSDGTITVSVASGKLCFIAVAAENAKILVHADARTGQVLEYGKISEGSATGYYSDGTIGNAAVNFNNMSAKEINKNFGSTLADAVITGTDYSFKSNVVAMPKDLVYFVNCGSETGLSEMNDPYYKLNADFLAGLPNVMNTTHDQQYNGNNGWGYDAYSANDRISCHETGTAYPFNTVRCIDKSPYGIGYNFTLDAGKYNIYVGTLTHWHPRSAKVKINGADVKDVSVGLTPSVETFTNVEPVNGKLHLGLYGSSTNEGMIAFIAIQPATDENKPEVVPQTPSVPQSLGMGENSFTAGNLKAGTKLQVSLSDKPYSVLYETEVTTDGEMEVVIDPAKLNNVYKLSVAAVSAGGASAAKSLFITDVADLLVTSDKSEWTTGNVALRLTAEAKSGVEKVEVIHNFMTQTIVFKGEKTIDTSVTAVENGEYEFVVYSKIGAFLSSSFNVENIDANEPVLTVSAAIKGLTDGKTALSFVYESAAKLTELRVYKAGELVSKTAALPETYLIDSGEYTFVAASESGKTASQTISVTSAPTCFSYKADIVGNYYTVELKNANGKEIASVFAYQVSGESAKRLTVIGTKFNAYEKGGYVVKVDYKDGTSEITTLTFPKEAVVEEEKEEKGCGSAAEGGGLMAVAVLLLAVGALALLRKKAYNKSIAELKVSNKK